MLPVLGFLAAASAWEVFSTTVTVGTTIYREHGTSLNSVIKGGVIYDAISQSWFSSCMC